MIREGDMMGRMSLYSGCFAAVLFACLAQSLSAQQEVVHPGETYDSLQAGADAYYDAEAQRRAMIGRQVMLEEQILADNTWADPKYKYQPVGPESYGPILPKAYIGPTLGDVYAYPPTAGGVVYYGTPGGPVAGAPGPAVVQSYPGAGGYAAPVPTFQPWPRVPNDIWGAPYYGYVRQPVGYVKIWTGRLSYIYKPVYASPPVASSQPAQAEAMPARESPRPRPQPKLKAANASAPSESRHTPPPPPVPYVPPTTAPEQTPDDGLELNPSKVTPASPIPKTGQEL
jgi:hypothetical protein